MPISQVLIKPQTVLGAKAENPFPGRRNNGSINYIHLQQKSHEKVSDFRFIGVDSVFMRKIVVPAWE
jgi:hypothetical protein